MNRKRMAKFLLKKFGHKIPVAWFSDYAVEYDPDELTTPIKLYVQKPNQKMPLNLMRVENAQRAWVAELRLPISYELFAMHEIGHLESEQKSYKEYENDLEIIEKLYEWDKISTNQYISLYNSLESEKNANDWAMNWIKNNENVAKMLDSRLN